MKKYGAIIINSLLLIFGTAGIWFTVFGDGFMNSGTFLYYTVQSNILAMAVGLTVLIFEIRKLFGKKIPKGVQFLRLFGTVAITLTFLVFSLMLTPKMIADGDGWYLTTPDNLFVHNLVPIMAILDWCLFGSGKELKKSAAFCGLVPAFAYLCFVHFCVTKGLTFSGEKVPYFFLDYESYGWLRIGKEGIGVIYWIIILGFLLYGLGRAYLYIANKRENKKA